jgi:hypothetical protein
LGRFRGRISRGNWRRECGLHGGRKQLESEYRREWFLDGWHPKERCCGCIDHKHWYIGCMGGGSSLGRYKFRVGCKAFVVISLITYLLLFGLAEAIMRPIPSSSSFIYWLLLIPTFPIALWGAFISVDWHERLIVGQHLGYAGRRGGHHSRHNE